MPPVFEFTDHYDATVTVLGRELPVKITRYSREQSDAMYEQSIAFNPRGTEESEAAKQTRRAATLAFFETVITDGIALDEGVIVDRGQSLTTGAQLIDLFHNRQDVLAALAGAVIIENRMMPSLAKNSNSPHGSATGSEASVQTSGEPAPGGGPAPIAAAAAPSATAPIAAATDASSGPAIDPPALSGVDGSAAMGVA